MAVNLIGLMMIDSDCFRLFISIISKMKVDILGYFLYTMSMVSCVDTEGTVRPLRRDLSGGTVAEATIALQLVYSSLLPETFSGRLSSRLSSRLEVLKVADEFFKRFLQTTSDHFFRRLQTSPFDVLLMVLFVSVSRPKVYQSADLCEGLPLQRACLTNSPNDYILMISLITLRLCLL